MAKGLADLPPNDMRSKIHLRSVTRNGIRLTEEKAGYIVRQEITSHRRLKAVQSPA
jgi:hypothetical protein